MINHLSFWKSLALLFKGTNSSVFWRLCTEAGTISDIHICNKDYHIFSARSSQLGILPYFWNSETARSMPQKSHPAGQEVSNFDSTSARLHVWIRVNKCNFLALEPNKTYTYLKQLELNRLHIRGKSDMWICQKSASQKNLGWVSLHGI